jgi:hypothetical protein
MNEYVENALQHVTGKSNIESISIEDLEHIANAHPYFAVAQVLLAKKLKQQQSEHFLQQVQKTALYFTNPYLLHYQLLEQLPVLDIAKQKPQQTLLTGHDIKEGSTGLQVTQSGLIELAAADAVEHRGSYTSFDDDINVHSLTGDAKLLELDEQKAQTDDVADNKFEDQQAIEIVEQAEQREVAEPAATTAAEGDRLEQFAETTSNSAEPLDQNTEVDDEHNSAKEPISNSAAASTDPLNVNAGLQEVEHHDVDRSTPIDEDETQPEPDFIFLHQEGIITPDHSVASFINDSEANYLSPNDDELDAVEETSSSESEPNATDTNEQVEEPASVEASSAKEQEPVVTIVDESHAVELKEPVIVLKEYEQQPPSVAANFLELSHPEFRGENHNTMETAAHFSAHDAPPAEPTGYEDFVPHREYKDELSVDYQSQYAYQENNVDAFLPEDFSQRPPVNTNIHQLDNPLVAPQQVENEIALDQFHPEEEEILEAFEQERANEEEAAQLSPAEVEPATEQQEITLPVHEEDSQIIDEFVESQHEVKPAPGEVQEQRSTPAETADNSSAPAPPVFEPFIPIEPYHTVDYFASQGIKLTLDKDPKDKLGKQLKSFTQWLKHMKKLGPEDALKSQDSEQLETKIQVIADTSNTPQDVVTEAMADVLLKQGKTHQAIELYNKLSFLYPDKSAYFADQIQKIKR